MKIVQSLWSKPGQKRSGLDLQDINKCGWPDRKYNYFSWALSMLQFKQFYDEVELVTDEAGHELLINKLKLPYTNVVVALDELNDYDADLWAIGKIYTYSIQEEPFIHADGDVYIWKKFSPELENATLLCQQKEEGKRYSRYYFESFIQIVKHFKTYPEILDKSINLHNSIKAINAGIIGGQNIPFFKRYADKAFEFIKQNREQLQRIDVKRSNIVFEQFLFHALAEEEEEAIEYFNPDVQDLVEDFTDFTGVPLKTTYIHTPGAFKHRKYVADALSYRLLTDYPEYYFRIINLIRTNQI